MTGITHDTLKAIIKRLPPKYADEYFAWRRNAWGRRLMKYYNTPEFLAECLQKLLSYESRMTRAANSLAHVPPPQDSSTGENQ